MSRVASAAELQRDFGAAADQCYEVFAVSYRNPRICSDMNSLIKLYTSREVNQATAFAGLAEELDETTLAGAYLELVETAPRRQLHGLVRRCGGTTWVHR